MNTSNVKVGDTIKIVKIDDCNGMDIAARSYAGRTGVVEHIDSIGQLHGTWGGLAVCPQYGDIFTVIKKG